MFVDEHYPEEESPIKNIGKRQKKLYFPEYQAPPICKIELITQLTPLALLAIVGACLNVLDFSRRVPNSLYKSMVVYIAGLMSFDKRQTVNRIAKRLGGVSHDNLTRLMTRYRWRCCSVVRWFIYLSQRLGSNGYLIIDDTAIQHKRSKKIEGVYWDFDYAEGRNVLCQRLVLVLWSNGYFRIPVGYALWHKKGNRRKYRTKNEIARTLVKWCLHSGMKPSYIVFDNWYASKENMRLFMKQLRIPFVTKLKGNCRLTFKGKKLQAKTIGRRILKERGQYICRKTGAWSRKAIVSLGNLGDMCFVVVKDDLDGKKPSIKYLLAGSPALSATEIVQRYKSRWIIETFFQDIKQHMGLSQYQGRKLQGGYHHIALCFAGAVVVDFVREKKGISFREAKTLICNTFFVKDGKGHHHLATFQPSTPSDLDNLEKAMRIVRKQLFPLNYDNLLAA